jgi:hypothetical protein
LRTAFFGFLLQAVERCGGLHDRLEEILDPQDDRFCLAFFGHHEPLAIPGDALKDLAELGSGYKGWYIFVIGWFFSFGIGLLRRPVPSLRFGSAEDSR